LKKQHIMHGYTAWSALLWSFPHTVIALLCTTAVNTVNIGERCDLVLILFAKTYNLNQFTLSAGPTLELAQPSSVFQSLTNSW
jgi:hypothetical protein